MKNEIRVWDPLVRIFHWGLVLGFFISYLTGEDESDIHIYAGYVVLGLITIRLIWGFTGTHYARFSNFIYPPRTVIQYLNTLLAKKPKYYTGHNPAGGSMVLVMLLCLFVVTVSGLKVYAIEEGLGPLAGGSPVLVNISSARADDDHGKDEYEKNNNAHGEDKEAEELWEEVHEVSSNFMLLLILLHITGVIVSGRLHNVNLVKAMFTGKKMRKTET